MTGTINLSQLPAPTVVEELDFETILAERRRRQLILWSNPERNRRGWRCR